MKKRIRMIGTAGLLVMALAAPAAATHTPPGEPFVPEYVETSTYFHCAGTKLSNNGGAVPFDTVKPTASYTTGAGCGHLDTMFSGTANHNTLYDFAVSGTFTGNIKNITLRYHHLDVGLSRALNSSGLGLYLVIDGEEIVTRPGATAPTVRVPVSDSNGGASRFMELTIRNIGLDSEADHAEEHQIELTVEAYHPDLDTAKVWLYDAAEFDTGLVINDATMAPTKVNRNT
jgi:hypothetical protein